MDVRKYFYSIDKRVLLKILERKIKDPKLMWLIKEIIYSDEGDVGLPIGNYTSQLFANIYLNEVDQYIKRELHIKYYFRYMDDSVLFVKTKEEAKDTLAKISKFLDEKLHLELNQKTQIFTVYAENEKADQIYRKIKKSRKIVISGELTSAKKSKNHNQRCAILLEKFYYY